MKKRDYEQSRIFRIGDAVSPNYLYTNERKSYPFLPDFKDSGVGTIVRFQIETPLHTQLEEPIYWVKFEKPFKIGIIPEGGHAIDVPTEWREEIEFGFLAEKLVKII